MKRSWQKRTCAWPLAALIFMLLLSACGGNSAPGETSANAVGETTTAAKSDDSATSAASGVKTVENELGQTEIPAEPKRIVSVNMEDMLLALDVPLVLATPVARQDYLNGKLTEQGTEIVPLTETVNYEAILAAQPDLIVASAQLDPEMHEQLQKIAPTIAFGRSDWRGSLPKLAAALGLEDRAQTILTGHEDLIAETKAKVAAYIGSGETSAFLRVQESDMRLFFPSVLNDSDPYAGYVGLAYAGLGLTASPEVLKLQQENADKQNVPISQENLPDITADRLFVVALSEDGSEEGLQKTYDQLNALEQGKIWQAVPAVKANHVYLLNMKNWLIDGPNAEVLKMNDLLRALQSAEDPA
ncbi:ABC transporter substrate-binding protein [Saccharibacillus sacchari]|uniref:ABC transporter substrate-binding protein n=1 Tax=Saccharibacillus sacchari TaxID=456493 RepID=A0ACC6PH93_9BACL